MMFIRLFATIVLIAGFEICRAATGSHPPFVLDVSALNSNRVVNAANKALTNRIVTIVDKTRPSPTGDPHDYISYGRYWWPDPKSSNGLPYIRRDGYHNREQMALGDEGRLGTMIKNMEALSTGWYVTGRDDYAMRAGNWIHAWFVTPSTRINPQFGHAQIRLGHDRDRGTASGLIDMHGFIRLIDALRMLQASPAMSQEDEEAVRGWFSQYLEWLTNSENGRLEHRAENNHGSWYLAQCISICRYLGREYEARKFAMEDLARIANQFKPDGNQPYELVRADSLGYSIFNLEAQFTIARLCAPLGVDVCNYESPQGGSLRKGLMFVRPYNQSPNTWPRSQLKQLEPGFLDPLLALARSACPESVTPEAAISNVSTNKP